MGTLLNFSHFGLCALCQSKRVYWTICLHNFPYILAIIIIFVLRHRHMYNFLVNHYHPPNNMNIYSYIREVRRVKLNYLGLAMD